MCTETQAPPAGGGDRLYPRYAGKTQPPPAGGAGIRGRVNRNARATVTLPLLAPRTRAVAIRRRARLLRERAQLRELVLGQAERCGGDVLLEVGDGRRARDRKHHGGARQEPGQRDLERGRFVRVGDAAERALGVQAARREREPGDERDAVAVADLECRLGYAVADASSGSGPRRWGRSRAPGRAGPCRSWTRRRGRPCPRRGARTACRRTPPAAPPGPPRGAGRRRCARPGAVSGCPRTPRGGARGGRRAPTGSAPTASGRPWSR